jgi:hypothetical protein
LCSSALLNVAFHIFLEWGVGRAEEEKENNVAEEVYFLRSEKMRNTVFS